MNIQVTQSLLRDAEENPDNDATMSALASQLGHTIAESSADQRDQELTSFLDLVQRQTLSTVSLTRRDHVLSILQKTAEEALLLLRAQDISDYGERALAAKDIPTFLAMDRQERPMELRRTLGNAAARMIANDHSHLAEAGAYYRGVATGSIDPSREISTAEKHFRKNMGILADMLSSAWSSSMKNLAAKHV